MVGSSVRMRIRRDMHQPRGHEVDGRHLHAPVFYLRRAAQPQGLHDHGPEQIARVGSPRLAMPRNVTGTVHAHRQTSLFGLPHQLLGDPFGLAVAVIAVAGETVQIDVLFAEAHVWWEDPVRGHVVHGPGSIVACQAQDLARAPNVGSFQPRVGVHEVHDRPGVDDDVNIAGPRGLTRQWTRTPVLASSPSSRKAPRNPVVPVRKTSPASRRVGASPTGCGVISGSRTASATRSSTVVTASAAPSRCNCSILSSSPPGVGSSMNSDMETWTPKPCSTWLESWAAASECPPRSKKLSSDPTSSRRSTSSQARASSASFSRRVASSGSLTMSPLSLRLGRGGGGGSSERSTLPEVA